MESPEYQLREEWLRRTELLSRYWPIGLAALPLFLAIPIALISKDMGNSYGQRLPLPLALYEAYSAITLLVQRNWASKSKNRQQAQLYLITLLYMGQSILGAFLFSILSVILGLIALERLGARPDGLVIQLVTIGYILMVAVTLALSPTLSRSGLIKKWRPPTTMPKNVDKRRYWKRMSAIVFGNAALLATLRGSALYYLLIASYALINSLLFLVVSLTALYELWLLANEKHEREAGARPIH